MHTNRQMERRRKHGERMAKRLACFAAALLIMAANTVTAQALTYTANVYPVAQAKSNWCWAACAEIAGKNVYPGSSRTQYDVVEVLYGGHFPNVATTMLNTTWGARYVAHNRKNYAAVGAPWSFWQIADSLSRGYAVIALLSAGPGAGGHYVVISSAIIDGATPKVTYADPANGQFYTCSFAKFCNGARYENLTYAITGYVNN